MSDESLTFVGEGPMRSVQYTLRNPMYWALLMMVSLPLLVPDMGDHPYFLALSLFLTIFFLCAPLYHRIVRRQVLTTPTELVLDWYLRSWRILRQRFPYAKMQALFVGTNDMGPFVFISLQTSASSRSARQLQPSGRLADQDFPTRQLLDQAVACIVQRAGLVACPLATPTVLYADGAASAGWVAGTQMVRARAPRLSFPLEQVWLRPGVDSKAVDQQLVGRIPISVGRVLGMPTYLMSAESVYSPGLVRKFFGSFDQALIALGFCFLVLTYFVLLLSRLGLIRV